SFFYNAAVAAGTTDALTAKPLTDASLRKLLGQEDAYLVGISAWGQTIGMIKIENDLWSDRQYIEYPACGGVHSGNSTWWLPSPVKVIGGSNWTLNATNQDTSNASSAYVILHLSYGNASFPFLIL
ncbi:hypothetical protein KKF73_00655, partial [Patescibacteria group bacterium]|nr:hypothetical protein [Patescibacteria group bacterium]